MKAAVYVGTRNMYPHMVTASKSLLANSDVDKIFFLIEDDKFPEYLPDCIETINVSKQPYFKPTSPNFRLKWTYMTLLRAALPKVFPDLDRILSLDDDVIAVDDVSDVWDLPIDDYYYSAAREPLKSTGGKDYKFQLYTQMGVVLFNLTKLREDGMVDKVIEALNAYFFSIAEQDCMNLLCQGHIYPMPCEYNQTNYTERSEHPRLIHYAAVPFKRWTNEPPVIKYRNMSWSEVMWRHDEHTKGAKSATEV